MARKYEFYKGFKLFIDTTVDGYNVGILHPNGRTEVIDYGIATMTEALKVGREYIDEEF